MFPPQTLEIGGIIVFALIMALSNVAGIGGSELAIPMVMAMFHFTTKPAIAITSFSIFLTTLGRFIMNFNLQGFSQFGSKNITKLKTLVNWRQ